MDGWVDIENTRMDGNVIQSMKNVAKAQTNLSLKSITLTVVLGVTEKEKAQVESFCMNTMIFVSYPFSQDLAEARLNKFNAEEPFSHTPSFTFTFFKMTHLLASGKRKRPRMTETLVQRLYI